MKTRQLISIFVVSLSIIWFFGSDARAQSSPYICSTNKDNMYTYYDTELAIELHRDINRYEQKLASINFDSYRGLPGPTAVSLQDELDDILKSMAKIRSLIEEIKLKAQCKKTPETLLQWIKIGRELSRISIYMNDIERFGLINKEGDECFVCTFITFRLSQVFDFIEARAKNEEVLK